MDTKHVLALLRWSDQDRGKARQLRDVIARLDLGEDERERILADLSDLREAAGEFVTAVSDADLRAAYERGPARLGDPEREALRAEMKRRGLG